MCRRAIEPRHGLWTLPAGFMENGETTAEAAARETLEEANARIAIGDLYSMYSLPISTRFIYCSAPNCSIWISARGRKVWKSGCSAELKSPGMKSPFVRCATALNIILPNEIAENSVSISANWRFRRYADNRL